MAVRRSPNVIHETVDERAMLVSPDGSELLSLNAVGTLVWDLLGTPGDAEDLAARLHPQFEDVPRDELEQDIRQFLDNLLEEGLVQETDA